MCICAYLWEALLCQNVLCVPRALWEHSLCLLCWCCRGSCTSVVVFSHGIHGMLGCVIGGVGMAGCHTLLICAHPCLSVGGFLCQNVLCVPRVLWEHSLPVCLVMSVVVFSHGFHGFPQMVRLRYWQRGYGRMPYPPNLCASVSICGRLSLPEGSVCSAYSVGHSLPVCLFGSVVVFSHGFHGFPQWLGCVIGGVGMAGMPYPPNLCASVPICGRHFSARMFCVFCVFCGNTLSVCFVGAAEAAAPAW